MSRRRTSMSSFPLESNLFLLSSETLDGRVLLRNPWSSVRPKSVLARPHALGHTPLPAWPFLTLGSLGSSNSSVCIGGRCGTLCLRRGTRGHTLDHNDSELGFRLGTGSMLSPQSLRGYPLETPSPSRLRLHSCVRYLGGPPRGPPHVGMPMKRRSALDRFGPPLRESPGLIGGRRDAERA